MYVSKYALTGLHVMNGNIVYFGSTLDHEKLETFLVTSQSTLCDKQIINFKSITRSHMYMRVLLSRKTSHTHTIQHTEKHVQHTHIHTDTHTYHFTFHSMKVNVVITLSAPIRIVGLLEAMRTCTLGHQSILKI